MKFKILKLYTTPSVSIYPGVIKTKEEWLSMFPTLDESDLFIKTDWFLPVSEKDEHLYIDVELISLQEWEKTHPKLIHTLQYEFHNFPLYDIQRIASYIVGICPHCFENRRPCNCMRDE